MQTPTQTPPERDGHAPENGHPIPLEPVNNAGAYVGTDEPTKKRSIAIPAILGIVALLALGFFLKSRGAKGGAEQADAGAPKGPKLTTVKVVPVTLGTIVETIPLTGQLKSNQDVNINSKIAGQVARVYVDEGQRVTQGQLLVQLDTGDLQQQINSARANLEAAKVKLQQAQVGLPAREAQINNAVREAQSGVNTAQARYQQALLSEPTQVTNARSQVESAKAAVQSAKARVNQARETAKQTEGQVNGGITAARAALAQSRAQLDQVRNGSRAQQIAQAAAQVAQVEAQVKLAQAQVADAQTNLTRQNVLYQGGAAPKANVDAAQTALKVAQAQLEATQSQLEAARQNANLIKEGSRTEEERAAEQVVAQREAALGQAQAQRNGILAAQAQVTDALGAQTQAEQSRQQAIANLSQIPITQQETITAQQALNQAKTQLQTAVANRAQIPVARADVPAAQAAVDNAQSQLEQSQLNLNYASIKAPVSGVVNTKSIDAGETVSPGATLLNVVSTSNVIFEAQIPASQLDQIKVGQPARVTIAALGKTVTGYVTEIIPIADARLRQFRVRISLSDTSGLTPGAFAQGVLQTQVSRNTLTVPTEDVRTDEAKPFVYVALSDGDASEVKKRVVKLGGNANGQTQIIGGLGEGDRVISGTGLYEDGQKVKVAAQK